MSEWIPIKWHYITDEEREREGYPKEWGIFIDSEMPSGGEEILITTMSGDVTEDVCGRDDLGYYLESGLDWTEDIKAWMPLPEPYKEQI